MCAGGTQGGGGRGREGDRERDRDWHPPTSEDLERRLPLLSRVWKETLRRHVVSQGTMRHVREAVEESHTVLPASKDVLILLHALHHDSELWGPDAHCWEPDRWDQTSPYWVKRCAWEREQEGGAPVLLAVVMGVVVVVGASSGVRVHPAAQGVLSYPPLTPMHTPPF